jgi:hypothetical protein
MHKRWPAWVIGISAVVGTTCLLVAFLLSRTGSPVARQGVTRVAAVRPPVRAVTPVVPKPHAGKPVTAPPAKQGTVKTPKSGANGNSAALTGRSIEPVTGLTGHAIVAMKSALFIKRYLKKSGASEVGHPERDALYVFADYARAAVTDELAALPAGERHAIAEQLARLLREITTSCADALSVRSGGATMILDVDAANRADVEEALHAAIGEIASSGLVTPPRAADVRYADDLAARARKLGETTPELAESGKGELEKMAALISAAGALMSRLPAASVPRLRELLKSSVDMIEAF